MSKFWQSKWHCKMNFILFIFLLCARIIDSSKSSISEPSAIFNVINKANRFIVITIQREIRFIVLCFTRHLVCLFYWANLPRGKEHEQDSGPMRVSPPYPIQKDQRDRPQHRELRALLFSMSVWVL